MSYLTIPIIKFMQKYPIIPKNRLTLPAMECEEWLSMPLDKIISCLKSTNRQVELIAGDEKSC